LSYDLLTTPAACDHHVARERMGIGSDRRTLFSLVNPTQHMARPVNGGATVVLYINDVLVPRDHPMLGWRLFADSSLQAGQRWAMILFNRAQMVDGWVIEVGYTTTSAYCTKCGGTNLMADYSLGPDGNWKRVRGLAKLIQRCLKLVLTSVCPFYPNLVCALRNQIGKKGGQVFTSSDASYSVSTVLNNLKTIQQAQATFQPLDPDEMLSSVGSVSASADATDPRVIGVSVNLTTYAGTEKTLDLGLLKSSSQSS
jgi:hypothetical protein